MANVKGCKQQKCFLLRVTFVVCLLTSLGLIIGGFFCPPMGKIDGSVLTAVGELLVFPTLIYGFRAVELGLSIKFQKGDASLEIHNEDEDDEGKQ